MGWMMELCAFILFFLSDYNDWKLNRHFFKVCFPAAAVLLSVGTVLEIRAGIPSASGWLRGLTAVLGAGFLLLLAYTLFFALPLEASYARPGEQRQACTTGVYALCRHPGVLWFTGLYVCLWAGWGLPLWEAVCCIGLNILLVIFEDRCVFPAMVAGYGAYQASTPFLLPSRQSIRACCRIN